MRKFLLIFACAFSFCVHSETNVVVSLTPSQWNLILYWLNDNGLYSPKQGGLSTLSPDGSILSEEQESSSYWSSYDLYWNISQILSMLHLLVDGSLSSSYDTSSNNILAYASSLHNHNQTMQGYGFSITNDFKYIKSGVDTQNSLIRSIYAKVGSDLDQIKRNSWTNSILSKLNSIQYGFGVKFDEIIQNLGLFHLSTQDGIHTLDLSLTNLVFILDGLVKNQQERYSVLSNNFTSVIDFLHSLSNGTLFASNVLNSCCCSNNQVAVSNYQDSVLAMLGWMTNQWTELAPADPSHSDGSNSVWSVWIPSDEDWVDLFIPNVAWEQNPEIGGWRPLYKPKDEQYDGNFKRIATQYYDLLEHYEAGDIDGQKFFAGLVDLQLHILANMSTQLYMIDEKMPSKTNLWQWIEQYKTEVQERVTEAQAENSEAVSTASALLDYTPFSVVGGHFPKVSRALNSLRVENDASPVVHIPIPRALRVSDSDELIVDVRESDWFVTGRNWCRWIFTFIWGWLFIRMGLVPVFYIFFFTVRVAEISAHLVFMGSVRGSSGIVSSFGAAAVDMVLSLIGIDTDFKKFVWGIMRD